MACKDLRQTLPQPLYDYQETAMRILNATANIVSLTAAAVLTAAQLSAIALLVRADATPAAVTGRPIVVPQVASQVTLPAVEVIASRSG